MRGDKADPVTRGHACIKGLTAPKAHYSPNRILRPLKRQPDGSFAPISLDSALDEIAARRCQTKGSYKSDYSNTATRPGFGWARRLVDAILDQEQPKTNVVIAYVTYAVVRID